MAERIEIRQNTSEAFRSERSGWDADYLQLSPGGLDFSATLVRLPGIQVYWNSFGNRMQLISCYEGSALIFASSLDDGELPHYRGRPFPLDHGMIYQSLIENDIHTPRRCRSLNIIVDASLVELMGWTIDSAPERAVSRRALDALRSECRRATRETGPRERTVAQGTHELVLRDRILARLDSVLQPWLKGGGDAIPSVVGNAANSSIVKKTRKLFCQDPAGFDSMERLAGELGILKRTLYRAFRRDLGMGLYAYLQMIRLHRLRSRLLAVDGGKGHIVAREALDLGFSHLGRLSETYRRVFHELPSETLRNHRQ